MNEENLNQLKEWASNGEKNAWKAVTDALLVSDEDDTKADDTKADDTKGDEAKGDERKGRKKPKPKPKKPREDPGTHVKLPNELGNMEIECKLGDQQYNGYILVPCVTINISK